jgi:hypothetical protein
VQAVVALRALVDAEAQRLLRARREPQGVPRLEHREVRRGEAPQAASREEEVVPNRQPRLASEDHVSQRSHLGVVRGSPAAPRPGSARRWWRRPCQWARRARRSSSIALPGERARPRSISRLASSQRDCQRKTSTRPARTSGSSGVPRQHPSVARLARRPASVPRVDARELGPQPRRRRASARRRCSSSSRARSREPRAPRASPRTAASRASGRSPGAAPPRSRGSPPAPPPAAPM